MWFGKIQQAFWNGGPRAKAGPWRPYNVKVARSWALIKENKPNDMHHVPVNFENLNIKLKILVCFARIFNTFWQFYGKISQLLGVN